MMKSRVYKKLYNSVTHIRRQCMADASINPNVVLAKIKQAFGGNEITKEKAQHLGIKDDDFNKADKDQDETITVIEALQDDNLFAQFASMCEEDEKNEENTESDKEKKSIKPVDDKNQPKS